MKHIPQDIRRMETKKKIVDAAMKLFSTKGYYQTNSKEIAKEAGVAIGSFYTYFDDKKALLMDILNTYIQMALPLTYEVEDSTYSGDRKGSLKNLIEKCFEWHSFTLEFYQQVTMLSKVNEEIGMVYKEYQDAIMSRIKGVLLSYEPSLLEDQIQAACMIIYSAIEGSVHSLKLFKEGIKESLLVNELVRFIDSYISTLTNS